MAFEPRLRSTIAAAFTFVCAATPHAFVHAANPWEMEAGQATTSPAGFVTVPFAATFSFAPVVAVLPTDENSDPAALRIRNVTAAGFDVALVEPTGSNGVVDPMTFDFVAVTPGIHQLPTGETVVALLHSTTTLQHGAGVGGAEFYDTVPFGVTLTPIASVVASLQTMNNETNAPPGDVSVPWLTVAMRDVSATSVRIALERSEVAAGAVTVDETIGVIALASGGAGVFFDDADQSISWSALTTNDNIRGWGNGTPCFVTTYSSTPFASPRLVGTKNRHDGGDGGWLRRCSLSGTSVGFVIDEDVFRDAERNHTTEAAGMLAFSNSFHALFEGVLVAVKTVSIEEDPINGAANAYAIPGARARYRVEVESEGRLPIDADTVTFTDIVPNNVKLVVADIDGGATGPVRFTDGASSSALSYSFVSLSSATDSIDFSNDGGTSFAYTPSPDIDGADEAVTHFRIRPQGNFSGDGLGAPPSFSLEYDVIIE